ncbi:hypothetical protein AOZ06_04200 [Kibdelosporangium phytohabitans]|uniref:Sialidase domain-containing protein n=1 Tax=Kibdelosporangium phytohabitans TaxID=860235 RepID=A0A0N9HST7_9PSEU|nr:hypothetical protein AOZ06_04200 [Kibdelosporangium phytohabitans]
MLAGEAAVSFDPVWWGFHVSLNRHAVKFLMNNIDELKPMLKKLHKKNPRVGSIVQLYIELRKWWVKLIDQGTGIRFSSPWLVPGALVPTVWHDGEAQPPPTPPPGDTALWWAAWENGKGWGTDMRFPSHHSVAAPAFSVTNNNTFLCLHRGGHDDEHLYLTVFKDGAWSKDEKLPEEHCSPAGPGMAWHPQHGLFAIYGRKVVSYPLHWTRRSGDGISGTWDQARPAGDAYSLWRPALCVTGDKLVCVYTDTTVGIQGRYPVTWMEMDLSHQPWTWTKPQEVHDGMMSQHAPALTAATDGVLVCAWEELGKVKWIIKKPDANAWSVPQEVPGATTNRGPAIAYCAETHNEVNLAFVTHSGDNSLSLVTADVQDFTNYRVREWNAPQQLPHHSSSVTPAVTFGSYRLEGGGTNKQIVCVHRGYSK